MRGNRGSLRRNRGSLHQEQAASSAAQTPGPLPRRRPIANPLEIIRADRDRDGRMTGTVVDASAAVKWLVSEAFSEEAASLLDNRTTLIGPELLFAEAAQRPMGLVPPRRHREGGLCRGLPDECFHQP